MTTSTPGAVLATKPAKRLALDVSRVADRFLKDIREDLDNDRLVCPSLPDVAVRVRKVLEDPAASGNDIAKVIRTDPALSAQVVRVANSAYYRGAAPAKDLHAAVVRLGDDVVQHVVMLLVVAQLYRVDTRAGITKHLQRLWQHSTLVASISELLAQRYTVLQPEVAMLAGLIHDIGVLPVLVRAQKVESIMADERILQRLLADLHPETGRVVLEKWCFPQELIAVAAEHEKLDRRSGELPDYIDLVQIANLLCYSGSDHPLAEVDPGALAATGKLGASPEDLEDIVRYASAEVAGLRALLQRDR